MKKATGPKIYLFSNILQQETQVFVAKNWTFEKNNKTVNTTTFRIKYRNSCKICINMSWHNEPGQSKNLASVAKNVPNFSLVDNLTFSSTRRLNISESYMKSRFCG